MPDYTRKQLDVDGAYVFPYTHADAVLYTTQNNLDGITSGTETNVKAVLDALDNTYRRLDSNILSLYNPSGKRGFLYLNGTTTTASMDLPPQGSAFYIPTLKYDSNGVITTLWQSSAGTSGNYVTLDTAQNITGEKTFVGDKLIKFKLSASTDKLGFTLYDSNNIELGFLEWLDDSINSKPALTLGLWINTANPAAQEYLGFKLVDIPSAARYALVTPLLADAKTPLGLSNTILTFYFPLLFKNGSTTVTTANSGVVDLSTLMPTGNVTTSAVVSASASGTSQISAALSDPYYNLVEGSSVTRSIRFVAGTGISISAATDGQITFTNTGGGSGGNITLSSILASSSSSTSSIVGDTLDPYYNVILNSAVNSSIQFKAGTNIAITADTNNVVTFNNTLTKMSLLTNNLFINGTQTATTGSWKGNLPAEITSLYNGLTIFYRLPLTGSGNASLLLYGPDGTTTIGGNIPVYAGNTRLTTHYPQYSIIRMTYYNEAWRANPYYNVNNQVAQYNTTSTDHYPVILGNQHGTVTGVSTAAVTNTVNKSSGFVYSPGNFLLHIVGALDTHYHGYYVRTSTTAMLSLVIADDGVTRGVRDSLNGKWLCYADDATGDTVKVPGTLMPQEINLAGHCLITYDSTNECINFNFL